jgi:hypothetical protein
MQDNQDKEVRIKYTAREQEQKSRQGHGCWCCVLQVKTKGNMVKTKHRVQANISKKIPYRQALSYLTFPLGSQIFKEKSKTQVF